MAVSIFTMRIFKIPPTTIPSGDKNFYLANKKDVHGKRNIRCCNSNS